MYVLYPRCRQTIDHIMRLIIMLKTNHRNAPCTRSHALNRRAHFATPITSHIVVGRCRGAHTPVAICVHTYTRAHYYLVQHVYHRQYGQWWSNCDQYLINTRPPACTRVQSPYTTVFTAIGIGGKPDWDKTFTLSATILILGGFGIGTCLYRSLDKCPTYIDISCLINIFEIKENDRNV